jgi:hypothetical protein
MNRPLIVVALLAAIASLAACKDLDCGDGTIEKDGDCVPADETVGNAMCGPNTVLQGTVCVPNVACDPTTTMEVTDPTTGAITCVGITGTQGCSVALPCPQPSDTSHQTVCGQIYNIEDDSKFQGTNPTGAQCTAGATEGPCALQFQAFDAVTFAGNPTGTTPQMIGTNYVDDCGRYRLENIATPGGPYIAIGLDDAIAANMGPGGVTNTMGAGLATVGGSATDNFDAFIAKKSTTDQWASSGGPPVSGGIYVNIFRAHKTGEAEAPGVTYTRNGNPVPNDDYYFAANATTRTTIDPTANVTGVNGTALVTNAKLTDSNSGTGGLDSTCLWDIHPASTIPEIVFVQVKHPMDDFSGDTCDL